MESRFVRRRKAAQARHICTVCVRRPAAPARTVCGECNDAAKERVQRRRRQRAQELAGRRALIARESAGDLAARGSIYSEALSHYDEALRSPVLRADDEWRLADKYARVLFCTHEPERAGVWLERALRSCRTVGDAENAAAVGATLLRVVRQSWLNALTVEALPFVEEAIALGASAKLRPLFARANLQMAHYLILLGRYDEAEPFYERGQPPRSSDDVEWRSVNYDQRAILYAARGERELAYRDFERAADSARRLAEGYWVTSVWDDYSIWALALGDIATAQFCRERALFVARERHVVWRIPYLSLRYADLLLELEQYDHARELVVNSLTYDCKAPCVRILVASVGTRLATVLGDEGLLRRCSDPQALESAFRSGEPARIGRLASALVRGYVARGETAEASALLRRALPTIRSADHVWDLMIDAATLGDDGEQRTARGILAARADLPSGDVAAAYLDLFDAARALRNRNRVEQRAAARRAAQRFARIGRVAQERMALGYAHDTLPKESPTAARPSRAFRTMLGGLSTLTVREAEVAERALKGLTNREIAKDLSISEHTVESHMASIMNRLGIRSRHQLSNMVVDSGKAGTA